MSANKRKQDRKAKAKTKAEPAVKEIKPQYVNLPLDIFDWLTNKGITEMRTKALYILLYDDSEGTYCGLYRINRDFIMSQLELEDTDDKALNRALVQLQNAGLIKWEPRPDAVWIVDYIKANFSQNPEDNKAYAIVKHLAKHRKLPFFQDVLDRYPSLKPAMAKCLGEQGENTAGISGAIESSKASSQTCREEHSEGLAEGLSTSPSDQRQDSGSREQKQQAPAATAIAAGLVKERTPDARLALAAAPDGPLAPAAAPGGKESRRADDCFESENDMNDPRRETLTKCEEENAAKYAAQPFWEPRVLIAGYELDKVCNQPGYFTCSSQDELARRYKLPLNLIKEYGLVIYVFKVLKALFEPASIWVRDLYGHIIMLLWEQYVDHTEENIRRIKAMRTAANRQLPAFAELPEVIPKEAEVTPAQVTAVEPQEEEIQTPCRNRLEFLEHLNLQELDSKFKANISAGLHDDCWKQDFKTVECQDALAKRFGLPLELMNRLAGAIVLTEKGYPWIVTSTGNLELLKEKEPDRLAKAENRKLAEAFLLTVQPGQIPMEQDPGSVPEQADEPAAEGDYEPDF